MKSQALRLCFIMLFCFVFVYPSFAISVDIHGVVATIGDCVSSFATELRMSFLGTTIDTTVAQIGFDATAFVLYDGYGTALGAEEFEIDMTWPGTPAHYYIAPVWVTAPQARPFTIVAYDTNAIGLSLAAIESFPIAASVTFNPTDYGNCGYLPLISEAAPGFHDGRINHLDMGNPVVVYGHDGEAGRGLIIYSPQGELLLLVTAEEIAAVAECPEVNTLIASAGNVVLYRLTDCRYQLNAPSLDGTKTYVLIFNDLYENTGYTSYEE